MKKLLAFFLILSFTFTSTLAFTWVSPHKQDTSQVQENDTEKKLQEKSVEPTEIKPEHQAQICDKDLPHHLGQDLKYTFVNRWHLLSLAVGIGAIAALHTQDDAIRDSFVNRPMGKTFDKILSIGANPFLLGGATLAALGISELAGSKQAAATAGTLLEAVGLTEVITIGLQLATHRKRPDGSLNALPSGHTSGAFALAAATEVLYGPWFGVPSFMLASLVGVSRIDANRHWATDVMGGALLGTLMGIGTAEFHKKELANFFLIPTADEKSAGLSMVHVF